MNLWFLVIVISVCAIRVDSQLDSKGFINIDCGLDANSSLIDSETKLTYVSDDQFIDTGMNYAISSQYATDNIFKKFTTVRSFPDGIRNCYTLRSLTIGSKYLIRGSFLYGNYDNKNKAPTFDVYLGVNYWDTVQITNNKNGAIFIEIIATANSDDYLQVCLVNIKSGTPFISVLELRTLPTNIYANDTYSEESLTYSEESLVHLLRLNLGASAQIRYPDDPYDRIWSTYTQNTWTNISTSSIVEPDTAFAIPSLVMQTAATTLSTNQSLVIPWYSNSGSTKFYVVLHMSEIEDIPSTALREFGIYNTDDKNLFGSIVLKKLYPLSISYKPYNLLNYHVSIEATSKSTLPPLLNAIEIYVITSATGILTNSEDVATMNAIKASYKVKKNWSGDPCSPIELSWSGVTCKQSDNTNTKSLSIKTLNLSSSGLTGGIVPSFGNLNSLQKLDLSYNQLSGDLTSLDKLSALTYLDVAGNHNLSQTLPPGLQSKQNSGNLTILWFHPTPSPPPSPSSPSPSPSPSPFPFPFHNLSPIVIKVVLLAVALLVIMVIIICCVCKRRKRPAEIMYPYQSKPNIQMIHIIELQQNKR